MAATSIAPIPAAGMVTSTGCDPTGTADTATRSPTARTTGAAGPTTGTRLAFTTGPVFTDGRLTPGPSRWFTPGVGAVLRGLVSTGATSLRIRYTPAPICG